MILVPLSLELTKYTLGLYKVKVAFKEASSSPCSYTSSDNQQAKQTKTQL